MFLSFHLFNTMLFINCEFNISLNETGLSVDSRNDIHHKFKIKIE